MLYYAYQFVVILLLLLLLLVVKFLHVGCLPLEDVLVQIGC